MDEKLVRRIQEEHKKNDPNALRNAKLLAISSVNSKFRIAVENILRGYSIGVTEKGAVVDAIVMELGSTKNNLRDAYCLIEKLFGTPSHGSMSEMDKLLDLQFHTRDWKKINEMVYLTEADPEDDPLNIFTTSFDTGDDKKADAKHNDKETAGKKQIKREFNEAGVQRIMKGFDSYIGWGSIKEQIQRLINLTKYNLDREHRGKSYNRVTNHMVFMGDPGTGKTTVARLVGKIYKEMGLLSKGSFIQVSRADLIGQHIGDTEVKTKAVIKKAMGGVLFIDEAYSLAPKDHESNVDYGNRAIEELIQAMENLRDDLIVIAAGYSENMQEFLDSNPGLKSRFSNVICFDDYNGEELYQISQQMISKQDLVIAEEAQTILKMVTEALYTHRGKNFGNARDVRNLVDKIVLIHADRVASEMDKLTNEEKDTITLDDCVRLKSFAEYSEIIPE